MEGKRVALLGFGISLVIIMYLIWSFIHDDFNFRHWSSISKGIFTFIAVFVLLIKNIINYIEENS